MPKTYIFVLSLLASLLFACSSTETYDANSAEGTFKNAEELEKAERFEEAVAKYREVKHKYPYSKIAVDAELRAADLEFKREAYVEAQQAYLTFKDFHPKHASIDYVTYQLAMSYYHQLPDTVDRDLSLADKAITYFDEVIGSFPNSKHFKDAREKKEDIRTRLAAKEDYIADFYFKRDRYESALGRYEELLETFPGLGFDEKALFRATVSAYKIGQIDKGGKHYNKLREKYPNSKYLAEAKRLIGNHEKH